MKTLNKESFQRLGAGRSVPVGAPERCAALSSGPDDPLGHIALRGAY